MPTKELSVLAGIKEEMKSENYLKPLTSKCKDNKCSHKKCSCGHCSQYHFAREGECCKCNLDLTTCLCKQFTWEL